MFALPQPWIADIEKLPLNSRFKWNGSWNLATCQLCISVIWTKKVEISNEYFLANLWFQVLLGHSQQLWNKISKHEINNIKEVLKSRYVHAKVHQLSVPRKKIRIKVHIFQEGHTNLVDSFSNCWAFSEYMNFKNKRRTDKLLVKHSIVYDIFYFRSLVFVVFILCVWWPFYVFIIKSIEIELIMLNVVLYGILGLVDI